MGLQGCRWGSHVGDGAGRFVVGFAREDRLMAEPEAGGSGLSERPVAPVCGSPHDLGEARHRVWAARNTPWRQFETPGFADHGIFRRAEPAADFGSRVPSSHSRRNFPILSSLPSAPFVVMCIRASSFTTFT